MEFFASTVGTLFFVLGDPVDFLCMLSFLRMITYLPSPSPESCQELFQGAPWNDEVHEGMVCDRSWNSLFILNGNDGRKSSILKFNENLSLQ